MRVGSTARRAREAMARCARQSLGILRAMAALCVVLGFLYTPSETNARLHAYFVLQTNNSGSSSPRIVFVLDTSGSMAVRADDTYTRCTWNECEDADDYRQSRISAARKAINAVVQQYDGKARFSLMTFGREDPPKKKNEKPDECSGNKRFSWAPRFLAVEDHYWMNYEAWYMGFSGLLPYFSNVSFLWSYPAVIFWDQVPDNSGSNGVWTLCGDNKPYPYLRWDDLGTGATVTSNHQTGPLPGSPIVPGNLLENNSNANREVQWFSRFVGARFQPNSTTDPYKEIICTSWGDYADRKKSLTKCKSQFMSKETDLRNQVWEQDFYYWPYVDGFVGYSTMYQSLPGWSNLSGWTKKNWNYALGWLSWYWGYSHSQDNVRYLGEKMGVMEDAGGQSVKSELLVPFYLPSVVGQYDEWTPTSEAEVTTRVLELTSHAATGGLDVAGGTPWHKAIGQSNSNNPAPSKGPFSNGGTVSKYIGWVQNVEPSDVCSPLVTVIITDGEPTMWTTSGWGALNNWQWKKLNNSLAGLRNDRDSKVYMVGFFTSGDGLNKMACAAAGSNNESDPCNGTPTNNWDTCRNPSNHATECPYLADSPEELATVLSTIVSSSVATDIPSGPGAANNDFIGSSNTTPVQTLMSGWTEYPEWKGHVNRELCSDPDPSDPNAIASWCQNGAFSTVEPTFGPCPQSRVWDAGTCLSQTTWSDRRLYFTDTNNNVLPIFDTGGTVNSAFVAELNSADLAVAGAPYDTTSATSIAQFIAGKDWKDGWKLPGLAASAPVVVRRIPKPNLSTTPSVGIRDPHCAGRVMSNADQVATSLVNFASNKWDPVNKLSSPTTHFEYQEFVMAADDLGLIHAFQYDSGNELWAVIPRFSLANAVAQYAHGPESMGQSSKVSEHIYGVSSTVNQGWVYDSNASKWRHLAIIGMGEGGTHYMVFDVSHASPSSPSGPLELLWTTADPGLAATYGPRLGETWSRPALVYTVANDQITDVPTPYFLMGSGYPSSPTTGPAQGRSLMLVDAITGNLVQSAELPAPSNSLYEASYAAVTDVAVGSHCVSRYWAEMQESYYADPAGRLFRWDLGRETAHESDGGGSGPWSSPGSGDVIAVPSATFPACTGSGGDGSSGGGGGGGNGGGSGGGAGNCTISTSNPGDPFTFSPAVISSNRIDDGPAASGTVSSNDRDAFLVALVSGSPAETTTDPSSADNEFNSSVYILVDDHRVNKDQGFSFPSGAPEAAPGFNPNYMRLALSSIQRTRTYTPYPGSTSYSETGYFTNKARPTRAPRIKTTGMVSNCDAFGNNCATVPNVEVYTIEYTIYEPGTSACDPKWFDATTGTWYYDEGSTYVITYRMTATDGQGFDLINGAGAGFTIPGGGGGGLALVSVEQMIGGDCGDGICGPQTGIPRNIPCSPTQATSGSAEPYSIAITSTEIDGFRRLEI